MADFLTAYSIAQPDKVGRDRRPPGRHGHDADVRASSTSRRTGWPTCCSISVLARARPRWCGAARTRRAVVVMINAARKLGVTAVPLNYRLSDEEATYVTDHCDATIVYVDAEFAPMFERIRGGLPKVRALSWSSTATRARRHDRCRRAHGRSVAAASPRFPTSTEAGATMIYTSGTTGKPKGAFRRGAGNPAQVAAMIGVHRLHARRRLHHHRPAVPQRSRAASWRIAQALGQTVVLQRKFDPEDWLRLVDEYKVTSTFSAPTPIRMVCNLPAEVKAKYDVSSMKRMIANAAPWSFALKQMYLADFPADSLFEVYGSHRARRQHDPPAGGSAAQARLVRQAGADGRDQAVRRRRQRGHRHRAREHRRAVREEPERVRRLLQAARQVPEGSDATATRPSATSPTATTRATSTSATARRT